MPRHRSLTPPSPELLEALEIVKRSTWRLDAVQHPTGPISAPPRFKVTIEFDPWIAQRFEKVE